MLKYRYTMKIICNVFICISVGASAVTKQWDSNWGIIFRRQRLEVAFRQSNQFLYSLYLCAIGEMIDFFPSHQPPSSSHCITLTLGCTKQIKQRDSLS